MCWPHGLSFLRFQCSSMWSRNRYRLLLPYLFDYGDDMAYLYLQFYNFFEVSYLLQKYLWSFMDYYFYSCQRCRTRLMFVLVPQSQYLACMYRLYICISLNVRVMWRMSPSTMHYLTFPHICNLYANIMLHIVHGFFVWNADKKKTLASKVIEKSPFLLYARYSQTLKRTITL